jgi:hypothetical protein
MKRLKFVAAILIALVLLIGTVQSVGAFSNVTSNNSAVTGVVNPVINVATKLAFIHQPTDAAVGGSISPAVTVAIEDAEGNIVTTLTEAIMVVICNNPSGAALRGTNVVNAVNGVATFTNLYIDKPGTGYTLSASTPCGMVGSSNPFNIIGSGGQDSPPRLLQITVTGLIVNSPPMLINEGSCIQGNYQLENAEGTVTLDVPIYNGCWDAAGHALTRIDATPTVSPSSDSEGNSAILAYTFGPDGAHFNPPLVLTLKYDSPSLAGLLENSLYAAGWDGSNWQRLGSAIDTTQKTITIQISHFSTYAVMGKVMPPPVIVLTPASPTTTAVIPLVSSTPSVTTTLPALVVPATAVVPAAVTEPTASVTTTQVAPSPEMASSTTAASPQPDHSASLMVWIGFGAGFLFILLFIILMFRRGRQNE